MLHGSRCTACARAADTNRFRCLRSRSGCSRTNNTSSEPRVNRGEVLCFARRHFPYGTDVRKDTAGTGPNGKTIPGARYFVKNDAFLLANTRIYERFTEQHRKRRLITTMLIGQEAEITNLDRAHWTVTFRIRCTSGTAVVPVPTSSSAEQQHSSSRAAAQQQQSSSTAAAEQQQQQLQPTGLSQLSNEVRFETPRRRSSVRRSIPTAHQPTAGTT